MWASHVLPLLFFYFWFCKYKIHWPVFWWARKMKRIGKIWEFSQYKIPKRVEGGRGVAHLGKFPKNRLQHIHHISHRRCRHFLWSNFAPHAKIALSCLWSKVYKYDKYAEAWTRRKPRNLTTQRSTRWFFSLLESRDCASKWVLHRCTSFAPLVLTGSLVQVT